MTIADGAIIELALKEDGHIQDPVGGERVILMMDCVNVSRKRIEG